MRKYVLVALLSAFASGAAFGQAAQRSTNPQGVQIQGNTDIKADQTNATAVASGENNVAQNAAGAIKAGTQIQGNTKIQASQKSATAVASGKNNTATNDVGVIGGK